jgi:hypothetical protein
MGREGQTDERPEEQGEVHDAASVRVGGDHLIGFDSYIVARRPSPVNGFRRLFMGQFRFDA